MDGPKPEHEDNFESYVQRLNAGAPIPGVARDDLRAALAFFADVRRVYREASLSAPDVYSFFLDDLARRCSQGADAHAVAIRGVVLEAMIRIPPAEQPKQIDSNKLVEIVATLPLMASDLQDPDAVRRRVFDTEGSAGCITRTDS